MPGMPGGLVVQARERLGGAIHAMSNWRRVTVCAVARGQARKIEERQNNQKLQKDLPSSKQPGTTPRTREENLSFWASIDFDINPMTDDDYVEIGDSPLTVIVFLVRRSRMLSG
jgi:hypothetical protein